MQQHLAYVVYYAHFLYMGVIFFGKSFAPLGAIDVLIVCTIIMQVLFTVCPLTTLEEHLFQKANLQYTYKSWTKWIHKHYGKLGHVLSFIILWSVSETTYYVFSTITESEYTNFLFTLVTTFF